LPRPFARPAGNFHLQSGWAKFLKTSLAYVGNAKTQLNSLPPILQTHTDFWNSDIVLAGQVGG
jgi:hypothetical protein